MSKEGAICNFCRKECFECECNLCMCSMDLSEIEIVVINLYDRQAKRLLDYDDYEKAFEKAKELVGDIEDLVPAGQARNRIIEDFRETLYELIKKHMKNEKKEEEH